MPYTLPPNTARGHVENSPSAAGGLAGLLGPDSPGVLQNPLTERYVPVVRRYRPTTAYNALREAVIDWEAFPVQVLEGTIRPVAKNATPLAKNQPEGLTALTRQYVISLGLLTTSWSEEVTDVKIGDRIEDYDPLGNPVHYRVFEVQTPFRSSLFVWLQLMDPFGD